MNLKDVEESSFGFIWSAMLGFVWSYRGQSWVSLFRILCILACLHATIYKKWSLMKILKSFVMMV